ncbi:MAG TPA: RecX family transcriptional regulator [Leptospiraceae bacterium]|nr:RecX family transcriptional regulator [Leptospiraceae bacterium]HNN06052.1 RecX family transcriptional regulator [Leptospiraceae bacterium]
MSLFSENFRDLEDLTRKYLKTRDRSSEEVRSFLFSKGISEERIDKFLDDLRDRGIINERRLASNFVYSALYSKKWGTKRILREWKKYSGDQSLVEAELEKFEKSVFLDHCRELFGKWKQQKMKTESAVGRLKNLGYSNSEIEKILRENKIEIDLGEEDYEDSSGN